MGQPGRVPVRHTNIAPRPSTQPQHTPTSAVNASPYGLNSLAVTPAAAAAAAMTTPGSGLVLPPGMDMAGTAQLLASMQSPTPQPRQRANNKTRGQGKAKTKDVAGKDSKGTAAEQSDRLIQELLAGLPSSTMLQSDPLTSEDWFPDPSSSMIAQDSIFQYLDSMTTQMSSATILATTPVAAPPPAPSPATAATAAASSSGSAIVSSAAMDVNLDTLQTVLGSDPSGMDVVGGSQVTPDARFLANVRAKRDTQRPSDSHMLSSKRGSKRAHPLQGFAKRHRIGVSVGNQMAILSPALLSSSPPKPHQLRQHPYMYYSPPKPVSKAMPRKSKGRNLLLGETKSDHASKSAAEPKTPRGTPESGRQGTGRRPKWTLAQDKLLLAGVGQQRWCEDEQPRDPVDFVDADWQAIAVNVSSEGVVRSGQQCKKRWGVMFEHLGEEVLHFVDNPMSPQQSVADTPNAGESRRNSEFMISSSPPQPPPLAPAFLGSRGGSRQLSSITEQPLEEESESLSRQMAMTVRSSPPMDVALSSPEDALRPQTDSGLPAVLAQMDLNKRWEMPVYCQLVADVVQAMSDPSSKAAQAVRKYSGKTASVLATSAPPIQSSMLLAVSEQQSQQQQPLADLLSIPISTSAGLAAVTSTGNLTAPVPDQTMAVSKELSSTAVPLDMSAIDQDMDVYLQFLQSLTNDQSELLLTTTGPSSSGSVVGGMSMAGEDGIGTDWAGLFESTAAIATGGSLGTSAVAATQSGLGNAQQALASTLVEMGNGDEDDANDDDFVLNDDDDGDEDDDEDEEDDDMASLFAGTPKVGGIDEPKNSEAMWGNGLESMGSAGGSGAATSAQALLSDPFLQQLLDMSTSTPTIKEESAAVAAAAAAAAASNTEEKDGLGLAVPATGSTLQKAGGKGQQTGKVSAKAAGKVRQTESFLASRQLVNPVVSLLDMNSPQKRGGTAKTPRKRKKKSSSASASIVRALSAASAVEMDGSGEAGVTTEVDGLYQDALQDGESIDVQEESLQADNSEFLFTAEQMAQLRDQQTANFQLVTQAFLLACAEESPHAARARHWKRQLDRLALWHSLGTRESPNDSLSSGGLRRFGTLIESAERRRARTGVCAGVTETGQPAPNPASFFAIPGITAAVPGLYEAVDEIHRAAQLARETSTGDAVVRSFGPRMDFTSTCACTPVGAFRSALALECVVPRLRDAVGHGKRRGDDLVRQDRPGVRLAAAPLKPAGGLPVLLPSANLTPVAPTPVASAAIAGGIPVSVPRRAEPLQPGDMRALREAMRAQLRGFGRDLHKVPRTRRRVFVQDKSGVPRLEWLAVATEPLGLPAAMHSILVMLERSAGFRETLAPRIVAVRKPKNRIHFMQAEDALLLMGLRLFGFDDVASLRAHLLPCKTASQLRNRINNLRARRAPPNAVKDFCLRRIAPFTLEEEETLRVGVLVYGDEFRAVNQNFLVSRPTIALAQVWSHVRGDFA